MGKMGCDEREKWGVTNAKTGRETAREIKCEAGRGIGCEPGCETGCETDRELFRGTSATLEVIVECLQIGKNMAVMNRGKMCDK